MLGCDSVICQSWPKSPLLPRRCRPPPVLRICVSVRRFSAPCSLSSQVELLGSTAFGEPREESCSAYSALVLKSLQARTNPILQRPTLQRDKTGAILFILSPSGFFQFRLFCMKPSTRLCAALTSSARAGLLRNMF